MKLHNLSPAKGAVKDRKRVGRGQASGKGGTATRGHKGAQSRSGYSIKAGFEGGQMPLYRRIPKFGFKNRNRVAYAPINLSALQRLHEAKGTEEITPEVLYENGLIGKKDKVKILGQGEVSTALTVKVHAASKSAAEAIEKAGGSFTIIE